MTVGITHERDAGHRWRDKTPAPYQLGANQGHSHRTSRVFVEQLDQFGEVRERAGQPIDLIDDNDVEPRAEGSLEPERLPSQHDPAHVNVRRQG